jgi:hypothetical protein
MAHKMLTLPTRQMFKLRKTPPAIKMAVIQLIAQITKRAFLLQPIKLQATQQQAIRQQAIRQQVTRLLARTQLSQSTVQIPLTPQLKLEK